MSTKSFIISVDPGLTTGWATLTPAGAFYCGEVEGQMPFLQQFVHMLEMETAKPSQIEIVCESYIITPETIKKSRQNYSLEIIGALRWIAYVNGFKFTLQTPTEGKSFSTDSKLKQIEWWKANHGHAMDAARHLMLYATKTGALDAATFFDFSWGE